MTAETPGLPTVAQLYEHAPCGLLVTDANGTLLQANSTFCRWLGRRCEDLIGVVKFQDLLTVGGRIFHQTHWGPLLQMQGSVAEVKMELLLRDNRRIPIVMNAVRRQHGATTLHELSVVIAEDRDRYERELLLARQRSEQLLTSERQAQEALALAEARLRLALHSANLFVWEVNPETGVRAFDDDIALLLGEPAKRRVEDAEFVASIHEADAQREAATLAAALRAPGTDYFCTYRLVLADGSLRTINATGRGLADEHGRLLTFVGILQDVTELTVQRSAAEDRALFAEQMMGIVSHDLRNPLSAIALSTQVLERTGASANQLAILQRIARSTARAQRLIGDLLDFTQARLGRGLSVQLRPMNPHEVAAQCVAELRVAYAGRELEHLATGAGECRGDPDRLTQLLGNLVSNAVHYGDGTLPIRISSEIGHDNYCLSVHNFGPAIPPDSVDSLFQPLQQGVGESRKGSGIGLGLYIVQEIARAHAGSVHVVSNAAEGTTFTARIPRRIAS